MVPVEGATNTEVPGWFDDTRMTSSPSDSAPAPAVLGELGSSVQATPLIEICSQGTDCQLLSVTDTAAHDLHSARHDACPSSSA